MSALKPSVLSAIEADHAAGLHTELAKLGGGPGPQTGCGLCAAADVTLSVPDARLLARVLQEDIDQMVDGARREPAPDGVQRLESIVAKLERAA